MIALAWAADFALFLVVLIVAGLAAAFLVCLVVWGATAAWHRFTRRGRDRSFETFVADEMKGDPEPAPGSDEAAAFVADLKERMGWS